jgi:hypothetical protein
VASSSDQASGCGQAETCGQSGRGTKSVKREAGKLEAPCPNLHLRPPPKYGGANTEVGSPFSAAHGLQRPKRPTYDRAVPRPLALLTLSLIAAALVPSAASAAPLSWSRASTAVDANHDANGISCPTATLCVVIENDGRLAVSTDPAAATPTWATFSLPATTDGSRPARFDAVTCPSAQLCLAISRLGDLFVATNPTSESSWTKSVFSSGQHYGRDIERLSCQPGAPCVGYDQANNEMVTTPTPAGGAEAWTADSFDFSFNGDVSCKAGPLCIAGTGSAISHTTNPGGGADQWTTVTNIGNLFDGGPSRDPIDSVACAGTFCLAGGHGTAGHNGGLYWTTNPTGDAAAWSSFPSFFREVSRLACSPDGGRCVAWAADGPFIFDATNPMGGKSAWTLTNPAVSNDYVAEVSCPDVSICFAISLSGYFAVGKDGFTGDTGQPIPTPTPGDGQPPATTPPAGTAPGGTVLPPLTPKPIMTPSIYAGTQFDTAPTQLDPNGSSLTLLLESASDAQATVRLLSTRPIVMIAAHQKRRVQAFGTAKVTLKANVPKKIKVKLTKKAKSYFKHHAKVKVKISVTATTPAGITKTTTKTTTIKRRRK